METLTQWKVAKVKRVYIHPAYSSTCEVFINLCSNSGFDRTLMAMANENSIQKK